MMVNQNDYKVIKYKNKFGENCELRPSEEQLKIITSELRQDQKIIACAGSGKTTTLVARLKYLIDHGVSPETIIISTFNVEAGRNIQSRAMELIGEQAAKKLDIGNIDKIAFRLYFQYIKNSQNAQNKQFGLSVKEYCYELFKFLQTRDGIKYVLDRYKYFFFDEFQDVNQLQYDILMLFKKHGCFLVVIGDDAQNIYGWRDSRIDIIQTRIDEDIKKFQGAHIKTYMLSTNYRCSKPITLFSNSIIATSKNLIQKSMRYLVKEQGLPELKPYLQCFKGLYNQNEEIISQIKNKLKRYQLKDIAILCSTNQPLKFFEEALEKHNEKSNLKLNYMSMIGNNSSIYGGKTNQSELLKQDRITLSTIHRAKGLEWKVVFFIGVNDEFFPNNFLRDPSNSLTRLEECRRLFYVGATRAINELYFAMVKNNKCHKVCRFFSGINADLYERDIDITDNDMKIEEENIKKDFERDVQVTKIIEQMDHRDLSEADQFLQNVEELEIRQIHPKSNINEAEIRNNNLFVDLGLYIDLLIQRTVAEQLKAENGYSYEYAQTVLFSIFWRAEKAEFIAKYSTFFSNKMLDISDIEDEEDFIEAFNLFYRFGKVDRIQQNIKLNVFEIQTLSTIYQILKEFTQKYNIEYSQITHQIEELNAISKEYFPEDYNKEPYMNSYKKFMNRQLKCNSILFDIYQVSKCGQLFDMTRRVLYRNDFQTLNPKNIQDNINNFIKYLQVFNYEKLKAKYVVNHGINLKGEIDLLADDTIYEIKASQFQSISKEYILQVLAYAALLRVAQNVEVNHIVFYNPLIGKIYKYNISNWHFAQQYIKFLTDKSLQQANSKKKVLEQSEVEEKKQLVDLNQKKANNSQQNNNQNKTQETNSQTTNFNEIGDLIQQKLQEEKQQSKPLFNVSEFSQPQNRPRSLFTKQSVQIKQSNEQKSTSSTPGYKNQVPDQGENKKPKNVYRDFKKYVKNEQIALLKQNIKQTKIIVESDQSSENDDIEEATFTHNFRKQNKKQISNSNQQKSVHPKSTQNILSQLDDIEEVSQKFIQID
ncbi:hypothetical protein ABPG72_007354 [Tetrahymena utriculariae]